MTKGQDQEPGQAVAPAAAQLSRVVSAAREPYNKGDCLHHENRRAGMAGLPST